MDGDEDAFDRRFQHQYHHQQQKNGYRRRVEYPYHDTPSTSNSLAPPVFDGSDNMTNSNFVILGTILLVTALHFLCECVTVTTTKLLVCCLGVC